MAVILLLALLTLLARYGVIDVMALYTLWRYRRCRCGSSLPLTSKIECIRAHYALKGLVLPTIWLKVYFRAIFELTEILPKQYSL
jgi:hypothetical protein